MIIFEATNTEAGLVNSDNSVHPRGRMGQDLALPPEENSSNGRTTGPHTHTHILIDLINPCSVFGQSYSTNIKYK